MHARSPLPAISPQALIDVIFFFSFHCSFPHFLQIIFLLAAFCHIIYCFHTLWGQHDANPLANDYAASTVSTPIMD